MMTSTELLTRDFATLGTLLAAHAQERAGQLAMIEGDRRLTYAALDVLVDRVAAALQRDAIAQRGCIAICAASSIEYGVVFLGALRAGIAVSPLAPSSTAEQLLVMLADCGADLLFLDAGAWKTLATVAEKMSASRIALDDSAAGISFSSWLAPLGTRSHDVQIGPADPFNIIYSSGTTGAPKGIVQAHRMRWAHITRAVTTGFGPQAVTLVSTPLYSNTTLVSFIPTLGLGGTVVLLAKFDPVTFLELAQEHQVTHAMLVPVQYRRIMELPQFGRYDLSSFVMKYSTSAPFSAELKADVLERWPGGLIEYYGMTEGGGTLILYAHEHPNKLHTVGQPAPEHDIRLIGDDGREVRPGELGEVVGHSPGMMTGYHNQPQKTAEAEWYDQTGKRFIRTGDIGRFDEDGFLTLMDRKKDMIISGGFNIYPSDIEAVILQHSAVLEAAVVGIPSKRWGETPIAFVTPKRGVELNREELAAFVNTRVGRTQRPSVYEIVQSLPRSAIGKVLKRELRDGFRGTVA
jgi:long-chain acyl-CoA synthetase